MITNLKTSDCVGKLKILRELKKFQICLKLFLLERNERKKRKKFKKEHKNATISSSFSSVFWFCWSSLFQEACEDLEPSSISGRIIAGCWWAAVYIIIASYTASLGSILISTGLVSEINSVVDLGNQEEVKYSMIKRRCCAEFFFKMGSPKTF